jgi:hypothetical protein
MFDDFIKNKANEHEAPVPPDAWDNIVQKKKKRRFAFWWWSSVSLLLLVLSAGGYFLLAKKNDTTTTADTNTGKQANNIQAQASKGQESTRQAALPGENTDAGSTATNDITGADASRQEQSIIAERKVKTAITPRDNAPEKNNKARR